MNRRRSGFSLLDLFVVTAMLAILCGLLFPTVQSAKEAARRELCSQRLHQLAIAVHNYHDTYLNAFPCGAWQYRSNEPGKEKTGVFGQRRISAFIALTPYLEQAQVYQEIVSGMHHFNMNDDASESTEPGFELGPFAKKIEAFLCPADENSAKKLKNQQARNNYRLNFGDFPLHSAGFGVYSAGPGDFPNKRGMSAGEIDEVNRGPFAMLQWNGFHSITDGTSNTLMFSERCFGADPKKIEQGIAVDPKSLPSAYHFTVEEATDSAAPCLALRNEKGEYADRPAVNWSGRRWGDGATVYSGFVTVLPPNAPSCIANSFNSSPARAIVTASSFHPKGVNIAFCDASVKFCNEKIDATADIATGKEQTDSTFRIKGKSNFGVWGALGSRNGGESVSAELE